MPNASDLRHRVAFKREDGSIAFYRYANVEPTGGRQFVSGLGIHSEITHVVTVRYDSNIDHTMTVIYKDRELVIEGPPINVGERNEWLKLTCREAV